MREVTGHHDQAEFGLGSPEDDAADLEAVHAVLRSVDWSLLRQVGDKQHEAILAVADAKARLLYTSAAPEIGTPI